ncbi:hypothetical protein AB0M28_15020 [Streptomyces sp. NPDC051940]|uniref:hypothetical protein n=1 Tax=Streptomyces sp. NPDC051940 TaxID=3155675 RepID=UPI003428F16C
MNSMENALSALFVLVLALLIAAPAVAGAVRERRIDRQIASAARSHEERTDRHALAA